MELEKISVKIVKKINLGNFETKDYHLSAEVKVEDGETLKSVAGTIKQAIESILDEWEAELKGTDVSILKSAENLVKQSKAKQNETELFETFTCPECKEIMKKKEGKEYYICNKHWGYPDMIKKGEVRQKKFYKSNQKQESSVTV
jgi:ssDNA-binding Zn-finger/Zn-ribbon topoisomerase 1